MLVFVNKIIFRNNENNFTIAEVLEGENKVKLIISGTFARIEIGECMEIEGQWYTHPNYGRQLKVEKYQYAIPQKKDDVTKFLSSGFIDGIGQKLASAIVNTLGQNAIQLIEQDPEVLRQVEGIGKKRANLISQAFQEKKSLKEFLLFCSQYDMPMTLANKIHKYYGTESMHIVLENPFKLAEEIWGIGFITADKIASQIGFQKDHPERIKAGLLYVLKHSSEDGHCFLPQDLLIQQAASLLNVDSELCRFHLEGLCQGKKLLRESSAFSNQDFSAGIYLPYIWLAECESANMVKEKIKPFLKTNEAINKIIEECQLKNEINLDSEQRGAINQALNNRVCIITGGPGTGKTTILKCLCSIYDKCNVMYSLAAPTGRAARRIQELTSIPAQTIHKLLEYDPFQNKFIRNKDNLLRVHSVIIDEASMMDLSLFHQVLMAIHTNAQLLLIGDVDQLPSVGPGNVLKDLIASGAIPFVTLQTIYRQAKDSLIVKGAHQINHGKFPPMVTRKGENGDFFFVACKDTERALHLLITILTKRLPQPYRTTIGKSVQVIAPMYKGKCGIDNLNQVLQNTLNPVSQESKTVRHYRRGDKVMQLRNNYVKNVFNGDVGVIEDLDYENQIIHVSYAEQTISYEIPELDEITLAYAITAHKAEGSEFDVVIILLFKEHYIMLQRNWLYTAVTRARKQLILIGEEEALNLAIKNNTIANRYSLLKERVK